MSHNVLITFDFDALALWLARGETSPGPLSRGEFGAHAIPRILRLLEEKGVSSTFFIPAHTILSYPDQCRAIVDAGHEIALHGERHEPVSALDEAAERAVIGRGLEVIERLTGSAPIGNRTPSFDFTNSTVDILTEFGIQYDSSLMGSDTSAYFARFPGEDVAGGAYRFGRHSDIVELPVSWNLDDYPHFEFYKTKDWVQPGLKSAREVFDGFISEIRYLCEKEAQGFLTLTFHPQVVGRGSRMLELERLIDEAADLGATFARCDETARAERKRLTDAGA